MDDLVELGTERTDCVHINTGPISMSSHFLDEPFFYATLFIPVSRYKKTPVVCLWNVSCRIPACILGDDVVREIREQIQINAPPPDAVLTSPFSAMHVAEASDIEPLDTIKDQYVHHVFTEGRKNNLSQKEIAERLGISVNTLKRHLTNVRQDSLCS